MKVVLPHLTGLVAVSFVTAFCSITHAEPSATAPAPLPPLQVLESRQVVRDGRTITYQRVVPPVLPPKAPATSVPAMQPTHALALTAEQQRRAEKKRETLVLTATVHDRRVTEVRWHQEGREHRAWSNIDFNHLAGVREIETGDHLYQLLLGVTNQSAAEVEAFNRSIAARGLPASVLKPTPPAIAWNAQRAEYLLTAESSDATTPVEVTAFLDTLHLYSDAHRTLLAEQAATRAADQVAREQWLKDHPSAPEDIVVRFWPIESNRHPTTGQ